MSSDLNTKREPDMELELELLDEYGDTSNWSRWQRCVANLLPGDRELLEHGDIDPSKEIRVRDDREVQEFQKAQEADVGSDSGDWDSEEEEDLWTDRLRELAEDDQHPRRFSYAAPLCLLEVWSGRLWKLRPPPEHPFHRFWRQRRQQAMGLAPPGSPAAAAAPSQSSQSSPAEPEQSQHKKPRLSAPQTGAASFNTQNDDSIDDAGDALQPADMVHELLVALQDPRNLSDDKVVPLSPEEQRKLALLLPGGQELSAEELTKKVQQSKTQLIMELVLEDRVRTLLEFGANPNPRPAEETSDGNLCFRQPLIAVSCPSSVIRLLLEGKADPNLALEPYQPSPLHIHRHNPEAVRMLLEAGANPHHFVVTRTGESISEPVEDPVFLDFIAGGAPAESLRLLLQYNAEIVGQHRSPRSVVRSFKTPIAEVVKKYDPPLPGVLDLVLKIPYPIPAVCYNCSRTPVQSCWRNASGDTHTHRSPEFLRALVRVGYPTRSGRWHEATQVLRGRQPKSRYMKKNVRERLEILESVTKEGQPQRRQQYLSGFWTAIMQAAPSLSGVVASLVLQGIVPEFQLRIV